MTIRIVATAAIAVALLSGCVTYPSPLQGNYATLPPNDAMQADATGAMVRWGGRIVQVEPGADRTCFEMVSVQLSSSGRPLWADDSTDGRFIACRAGFYDPAVFEKNREVTFTGRVEGYEQRKIGEYAYRFPRVAADVIDLWPVRERVHVVAQPMPPWGPWWWW